MQSDEKQKISKRVFLLFSRTKRKRKKHTPKYNVHKNTVPMKNAAKVMQNEQYTKFWSSKSQRI